ncbi:aspartyl/glutamyl-tRNA(Asn/Gln) amidotransferase subunit C [Archaeoglobus sulfaticallidus PM70-1]|uniref:Aspartyl/glutamyl-tRNA(Asn/Gln) amidotransferase subunit C n=1 Tax=Archaeoglobus sulfaticallidus PM70-1 TaxID=387631 RepID=N0BKT4_9EURY|nr:Asp-tRNA(Asn)/Glu-tRNA(Gln) amidotransferase subunit GatC [Archaeoglobus sulfaticallidus]AGK61131.1 aspartyl/glutamyl-tRNA(Asn/Gln) amidotransferase subunit C [Archaeoglobus sulfaticallidus PM70-1]
MITRDEVVHISKLAKIALSDDEIERFRSEFESILEYFESLDDVRNEFENFDDVEPTFQVLPLRNVFRDDVAKDSLDRESVLMNAKHKEEGYFKGPRIVE